jgi:methylmalonyl-CoA mutase cobalamin-binding domain/chain
MSQELSNCIVELRKEELIEAIKEKLEGGEDAVQILNECRRGMTIVGERFQAGDYYLAELMLSADIFKSAVVVLDPHLAKARSAEPMGKVILATMKGDIHDLGKDIVATLLRARGFEVHDLGVDVAPGILVEKVGEINPDFVGFSALITTAFDSMKEAAGMLEKSNLRGRLKLMVGGGVTTAEVKEYVGADFQTIDATEGVAYCVKVSGGK